MHPYQFLEWDSLHFNQKVAQVRAEGLCRSDVDCCLKQLHEQGFTLVYLFCDTLMDPVGAPFPGYDGYLVDEKVTFIQPVETVTEPCEWITTSVSEPLSDDLLALAVASGEFSRFRVDPRIPSRKFHELFHLWLKRCVRRQLAEEVLVYQDHGTPAGLMTLVDRGRKVGALGLVAVAAGHRRKGIGRELLNAAHNWFWMHGFENLEVVTQRANAAACRFYRQSGFAEWSRSYVYHLWLNDRK